MPGTSKYFMYLLFYIFSLQITLEDRQCYYSSFTEEEIEAKSDTIENRRHRRLNLESTPFTRILAWFLEQTVNKRFLMS